MSAITTPAGTYSYTYDAGGNITSRQTYDGVWWDFDESSLVTDTYTYGDSQWKDLLTAYNGQTITYDTIGNPLTYKNGEAMTWVGGRRLSEIYFDDYGDMLFFDYDSEGMRLRKYGPRVNDYCYSNLSSSIDYIDYYYDGGTLIYELRRTGDGDEAITGYTIEYLYGVNGITGFKINNGTTVTTYYYVKNIMGDVLGILNASGTLVAEYRYDAYGNPVMILDGNGNDVSTNYSHIANINPIRYRGYYYDVETGFYYLNSRYYDPEIGRFINADDSSLVTATTDFAHHDKNLFAYCDNNPVVRIDVSGAVWDTIWDVASLVISVVDVAVNPSDPWSWIGLAGDVVDLVPFVTCVGEATRVVKTTVKVTNKVDNAVDAVSTANDIKKTTVSASKRSSAVKKAWKNEYNNVKNGGTGVSRNWTISERTELLKNGKVKGYQGHHMKSVAGYPHLAGDPNNIQFLTSYQHLQAHMGNWRNVTHGRYIE